jgi:hypothetical protein
MDCSFQQETFLNDGLVIRQVINPLDETITIQMEYNGLAWLGFAFSESGGMVGSTAVIGVPDGASGFVGLFLLGDQSYAPATPLEDGHSKLTNATALIKGTLLSATTATSQTRGESTIVTFTMPLVDADGKVLAAGGELSRIIYAIGSGTDLTYHAIRGSVEISFANCRNSDGSKISIQGSTDARGNLNRRRRRSRRLKGSFR